MFEIKWIILELINDENVPKKERDGTLGEYWATFPYDAEVRFLPLGGNIPYTAFFHVLQGPINTIELMINLLCSSVKAPHRLLKMESYCI